MSKAMRFNYICAAIIMLIFCFLFARKTMYWYADKINQIKTNIENYYAVPPKEAFLKRLYWDYMQITNRKNINGVIIMNDGRLDVERYDNTLLSERADIIIELKDYLNTKNTPFLFCRAPNFMQYTTQLPRGYENTVIEDTANFMSILKENDVDTFDFRNEMNNEGIDFSTVFYRGDNHWNAEGAFWAFGKVGELMNNEYGFQLNENTWNPDKYEFITFNKTFLGSVSRRIGDPRLKEDITFMIPKFQTKFEISDKILEENQDDDVKILESGDFVDVFTPTVKIENNDDFKYGDLNAFGSGFRQYTNLMVQENKKILVIGDSFVFPFSVFLATAINVDNFYLRHSQNYQIYQALEIDKYDLVIFLVFDGTLLNFGDNIEKDRLYLGEPSK